MKLVHWSSDIVTSVRGRRQYDPSKLKDRRYARGDKPNGFWLSDESRGAYGWRSWCRDNAFRTYSMRYKHEVELVPDAKILHIRTQTELYDFTQKYGYSLLDRLERAKGPSDPNMIWQPRQIIDSIEWWQLTKKYHGIIITPYLWSCRLESWSHWYYTWDCASGVIWNPRAIASVRMVKEYKVPKKPTVWQQRRKHKRMLAKMRESTRELTKMIAGEK